MKWFPKSWADRCVMLMTLAFLVSLFFIMRHSESVIEARELREERIERDVQVLRDMVRELRERSP